MFENDKYNAGEWEEVELLFEPSGKAPKKYGDGVYQFYASLTLSVILPRRGWELVKKSKNYAYLKPPIGNNTPPFSIKIKIPNKEQVIEIAKDCYEKAESWMGQIGEWPVWYTHKCQMKLVLITNDPIKREMQEKPDDVLDSNSYLQIGEFGIWENTISKKNDEDFKFREHRIVKVENEINHNEIPFLEGQEFLVELTKYERNIAARKICIEHYGSKCQICDFDFSKFFGKIGEGFIHVHHIVPISQQAGEYQVNPVNDLRPLCPNCHAMAHRKNPPYTIEELKNILNEIKINVQMQ
jgi:hypothetical protein